MEELTSPEFKQIDAGGSGRSLGTATNEDAM